MPRLEVPVFAARELQKFWTGRHPLGEAPEHEQNRCPDFRMFLAPVAGRRPDLTIVVASGEPDIGWRERGSDAAHPGRSGHSEHYRFRLTLCNTYPSSR